MPSDKDIVVKEQHHLVGNGIHPGGTMKGCAHNDAEYSAYIAFGTLPNPECPAIARWNNQSGQSNHHANS